MNSKNQIFLARVGRSLTLTAICLTLVVLLSACSKEEEGVAVLDTAKDNIEEAVDATNEKITQDLEELNEEANTINIDDMSTTPSEIDMSLSSCASATITTNLGTVEVSLDGEKAPIAVANFCTLAKKGFYDGVIFHRVIEGFMIQGGDPEGTGTGGPGYKFEDELPANGDYEIGSLAMANAGPNTNGSQFFIVSGPSGVNLPPLYTLFGQVTEGLDIVEKIQTVETLPGDKPVEDVVIESVEVK